MECTGAQTLPATNTGKPNRIAIFASGRGTNARALIEAIQSGRFVNLEVACVVTDRPGAPVIDIAQQLGVEVAVIPASSDSSLTKLERQRDLEERQVEYLQQRQVNLVCLAGYMRLVGPCLLGYFYDQQLGQSRIINIHPSLLPQFPGKNAYYEAYRVRAANYGCTIHFVDRGMDTGAVIFQRAIKMPLSHTYEELVASGLQAEHQLYNYFLECWSRGIVQQSFSAHHRQEQLCNYQQ